MKHRKTNSTDTEEIVPAEKEQQTKQYISKKNCFYLYRNRVVDTEFMAVFLPSLAANIL